MKFTYLAPNEYNDLSSGFRTVESEYNGPADFKVYIDPITRKINKGVEFDHDGPCCFGGTDNSPDDAEMVYLHSHNPNHIVLMALLTNCEDHIAINKVEVVCEQYNMQYQRYEPPAPDHTYSFKDCTIDENGVVTYPWYVLDVTWDKLVAQAKSHKNMIRERQRVDVLTQSQHDKADYCCEIIDYIIINEVSKNHPWKIAFPDIHSVTLDNSVPIGIPDGVYNGPLQLEKTKAWGIVCHESCCHADGDDVILESCCATPVGAPGPNLEDVPAFEVTPELPTHSAKCKHYHQCDDELCDGVDGTIEISFEEIAQKHEAEWAALKASSDTHTDHNH
jgi:hypothetical protein